MLFSLSFFFFLLLLNTCLKSLCLFFGCISGKKKTLSLCVCVLFDKINVAVKAILFFCCYCRSLSSSLHCTRFTAPSFCWHKHSFIIPFSLHHRCQLQHTHTHTQSLHTHTHTERQSCTSFSILYNSPYVRFHESAEALSQRSTSRTLLPI